MKVVELKKILDKIPDDFDIEIEVEKYVKVDPNTTLYGYPWESETCQIAHDAWDIGWSGRKAKLMVTIHEI